MGFFDIMRSVFNRPTPSWITVSSKEFQEMKQAAQSVVKGSDNITTALQTLERTLQQ